MGNIMFQEHDDGSIPVNDGEDGALHSAAFLLGLAPSTLTNTLCTSTFYVGGETTNVHRNPWQCAAACDAIVRAIYGRIFAWIENT
jgi:myosin heavy subunit